MRDQVLTARHSYTQKYCQKGDVLILNSYFNLALFISQVVHNRPPLQVFAMELSLLSFLL